MNILDRACLLNLEQRHLELILKWRNQKRIRNVMYNHRIITWKEHKEWYEKYLLNESITVKIFYLDDKPLGVLTIDEIDIKNRKCKWGFYIGDENAPKGIGKVMGYLGLRFIFDSLEMNKVCAEVLDFNKKSEKFHHNLYFSKEGTLREHLLRDNKYINVMLMSLLEQEWNLHSKHLENNIKGMII